MREDVLSVGWSSIWLTIALISSCGRRDITGGDNGG